MLKIVGTLDETTPFPSISLENKKSIIIDLDKVDYINSAGIRGWTKWVWEFENVNSQALVVFQNVPPIMARQVAVITDFLARNSVFVSVWAPYVCENCNSDSDYLLYLQQDCSIDINDDLVISHTVKCADCGANMVLDQTTGFSEVLKVFYARSTPAMPAKL